MVGEGGAAEAGTGRGGCSMAEVMTRRGCVPGVVRRGKKMRRNVRIAGRREEGDASEGEVVDGLRGKGPGR